MNQYDLQPLDPQERQKMTAWATAFVVAFTLFIIALLSGCKETEDPLSIEEKLHGAWQRNWLGFEQTWFFDDGLCTAHSMVPGQPVQAYAMAYTFQGDTITMVDLASGAAHRDEARAVVTFPTDSTAVLSWLGGVNYFLKKLLKNQKMEIITAWYGKF